MALQTITWSLLFFHKKTTCLQLANWHSTRLKSCPEKLFTSLSFQVCCQRDKDPRILLLYVYEWVCTARMAGVLHLYVFLYMLFIVFRSVEFSSSWYLRARDSPHAPNSFFPHTFPRCCLPIGGLFSSFRGKSSGASFFPLSSRRSTGRCPWLSACG